MRLNPFRALRPDPKVAARVASPPYDVVSRGEAAELAKDNPLSFLHIVRSDIDLPEAVEPHDARVYLKARENLDRLVRRGALLRDPRPSLYLYRLIMDGRAQVGVVGCVHVGDYERGVIKKHETTRPDKEDDRTLIVHLARPTRPGACAACDIRGIAGARRGYHFARR